MARANMLIPALDAIFAMGMNPEVKTSDRTACLKFVVEFAAEAQGGGSKQISRLSPEAARIIAKMGLNNGTKETNQREVRSDAPEGERVRGGGPDGPGSKAEPQDLGGLGHANHDGDEGA